MTRWIRAGTQFSKVCSLLNLPHKIRIEVTFENAVSMCVYTYIQFGECGIASCIYIHKYIHVYIDAHTCRYGYMYVYK